MTSYARLRLVLAAGIIFLAGCSGTEPLTQSRSVTIPDSILATIDGTPVYVHDFVREYARIGKTDSSSTDSLQAYQDFLERYVNFRLKVLEARRAGYPSDPSLKKEIGAYRSQLARPFLIEQEVTEPLIREMYLRRKSQVEASHILIRVDPASAPEDTLAARARLSTIKDSLDAGASFAEMAFRYSEDPSAQSAPGSAGYQGYLGYFGGGRMVKAFEDAAFSTPVDSTSSIFRSQFGYHILHVHNRIPTPPDIRMAHIMIQPKAPTAADSAVALGRIRDIQTKLESGESFADLAKQFSDDKASGSNGGELQKVSFDTGLPPSMRDAAFSMEPGEVSDVLESPFGFHLITILEKLPIQAYEDMHDELSTQLSRLPRSAAAQQRYAESVRLTLGEKADSTLIESWGRSMTPDSLFRTLATGTFPDSTLGRPFLWLGDSTYTVGQFTDFFKTRRLPPSNTPLERVWASVDLFFNDAAINQEVAALEDKDPTFGSTMAEFRDGLILFRLMEDSVWTAASTDSLGLRNYFRNHTNAYRFEDRTRIVSLTSSSDSLLSALVEQIRNGIGLDEAVSRAREDTSHAVRHDYNHGRRQDEFSI